MSHPGYRVIARGDTMNAAIDAARQLLLVDGLDVPVEELRCAYDGTAFVAMTRKSLDETVVERRTMVSQVGFLHFEPAVLLEAGDTCWTWGRSLVISDALGVVRRVQARPHRASDIR